MNTKDWHYYISNDEQGILTLNEVVQNFNDGIFSRSTLIRRKNWVYWLPLRKCHEIIAHLKWDYLDEDNHFHKNLFGYEITSKILNNELSRKTPVRLDEGLLVSFKDSYLTPTVKKPYKGYSTVIYPIPAFLEIYVLFFVSIAISTWLTLNLEPKPSKELAFFLIILIDNLILLLHSYFISKKGYSLYSKLFGLNLLSYDGSKLSVWKAYSRHFAYKQDIIEFDQDMGIILTKQKPKTD